LSDLKQGDAVTINVSGIKNSIELGRFIEGIVFPQFENEDSKLIINIGSAIGTYYYETAPGITLSFVENIVDISEHNSIIFTPIDNCS
jgi:hypothetical protein